MKLGRGPLRLRFLRTSSEDAKGAPAARLPWSRMVLQLQHSDMKMGLVGICSWQDCAFWRFWCEKPCTSIVLDNRSLMVTATASNAPQLLPWVFRNRTQD